MEHLDLISLRQFYQKKNLNIQNKGTMIHTSLIYSVTEIGNNLSQRGILSVDAL